MDLTELYQQLKTHIDNTDTELKLLQSGRKASAPRVRKSLMEIKKISHLMRTQITSHVKSLPITRRVKKETQPVVKSSE